MMFAVCPDVLHRVQFRCVWGQVLSRQATFLGADELLSHLATVGRQSVPNQQDVALNVTEQVLEELNDLFGLNALLENLEIEVPGSEPGDDRNRLPVEMELQHRRLPARRPSTPPMRPLTQAAFIYEYDGPAFFLSFFLISGQPLRFQSSIRASSRSSARPTGCCTLQFNCRKMRQTCPG